ncbi:type III PLP-dependent enzyme [Paenibacillus chitinolyticus]|uniref:type III PLP-dependent enzyme n=1 Tax=Paenibacillus chitinolyticus TaxID=79263 RepID=UPI0036D98673
MINDDQILEASKNNETPFYLYDGIRLQETYNMLRKSFHPSLDIFLSLKANNNVSIAKLFKDWGAGIEVASKGELYLALQSGFKPENIIFSGPGKRERDITEALNSDIYSIIAESMKEVEQIIDICKRLNKKARIGLRVNPDFIMAKTTIKMGGVPRQFGIDESEVWSTIELILNQKSEHVEFYGIHIYMGTQILSENQIIENISYTLNLARKINKQYQISCPFVNIGGGFGIAYFTNEEDIDIKKIINLINEKITGFIEDYPSTRIIFESGRYLLAKSGNYISKIVYVKESKGEKFVIIDGGMNHHAASTFRGRYVRNNYPIKLIKQNLSDHVEMETEIVNIVGPLCTPEDCVGRSVPLPVAEIGDLVCINNSGAYGLSYSPVFFLGHSMPAELLLMNGKLHIIRKRGNEKDLLLNQSMCDLACKPHSF